MLGKAKKSNDLLLYSSLSCSSKSSITGRDKISNIRSNSDNIKFSCYDLHNRNTHKKNKTVPTFYIFLCGHMFGVLMAKTGLSIRTKNDQFLRDWFSSYFHLYELRPKVSILDTNRVKIQNLQVKKNRYKSDRFCETAEILRYRG